MGYNGNFYNDMWEYDPSTNIWIQKASFGGTGRHGAVGFAIGNKGYVGTGSELSGATKRDFWEYDPLTNIWMQRADFGGSARTLATGFGIGNKGYIGTGTLTVGTPSVSKDFWEFDPSSNTWVQKADFGGASRYLAVGLNIVNKGYIGTGSADHYSGSRFKDFWEYNPLNNTWTSKADFGGIARDNCSGFTIGNYGFLGLGIDSEGNFKYDLWKYTPTTQGAALNFDGVNDFVSCGNNTSLQIDNQITVEAWVNTAAGGHRIMGKYADNLTSGWRLYYNGTRFAFGVSSGLGDHDLVSGVPSTPNQWHHVAGAYNKIFGILKIYVDGVVTQQTGFANGVLLNTTSNLDIGRFSALGSAYFSGAMDEVRIWNTVRTCDQINQLRNCELTGSESGLVAYFTFNQGAAAGTNTGLTQLADATTNSNGGTLNNFTLYGATSNWVTPGGVISGTSCPGSIIFPEIDVQGNGVSIDNGDITPSLSDDTYFGNVSTSGNLVKTFTIQNTGTAPLAVSGISITGADAALFTVGSLTPASPIPVGGSGTFTITFAPTSTGLKTATVTIANNDCDEGSYNYAIQGGTGSLGTNLCPGGGTTFTASTTGSSYQWQLNAGSGFVNLSNGPNYSGADAVSLHLSNIPSSFYGYQYQCLVNGVVNSNLFKLEFVSTYTGGTGGAWENTANWSCSAIPDANTDVVINSGSPVVNSNRSCRSVTLKPGTQITVKSGFGLTITGK
ncbi:MAG: choice-of-anchor D domain-containing protein [Chitinophagaceae bacterium]